MSLNDHDEYLRQRGPRSEVNWPLIVVLLGCLAFWAWVAYGVAGWLP